MAVWFSLKKLCKQRKKSSSARVHVGEKVDMNTSSVAVIIMHYTINKTFTSHTEMCNGITNRSAFLSFCGWCRKAWSLSRADFRNKALDNKPYKKHLCSYKKHLCSSSVMPPPLYIHKSWQLFSSLPAILTFSYMVSWVCKPCPHPLIPRVPLNSFRQQKCNRIFLLGLLPLTLIVW